MAVITVFKPSGKEAISPAREFPFWEQVMPPNPLDFGPWEQIFYGEFDGRRAKEEAPLPCVAHWKQNHFVVIHKITKKQVYVADPAHGLIKYTRDEFLNQWASTKTEGEPQGICLLLEPTPDFYNQEGETRDKKTFRFLFSYLKPYGKFITQLVLGMILGALLQLIFPFLTQAIVDIGISNQDLGFI